MKSRTGTKPYFSPEMIQRVPYDWRTDIFSLGCVLYELCTFVTPFELLDPITKEPVKGDNDHKWNTRVIDKPHNPIPAFYSRELNRIISKMLEKE